MYIFDTLLAFLNPVFETQKLLKDITTVIADIIDDKSNSSLIPPKYFLLFE